MILDRKEREVLKIKVTMTPIQRSALRIGRMSRKMIIEKPPRAIYFMVRIMFYMQQMGRHYGI